MNYIDLSAFELKILQGVQRLITTSNLHQKTFGEFKNKHNGKNIVIVGAGPTLNYFEPIENAIYIGVNRVFLNNNIKFDYLFALDKAGLATDKENYLDRFIEYKGNNCIKFIGDQNLGKDWQIPEGKILSAGIRRYKTTSNYLPSEFALDIESQALGNFATVAMQALQFALYTNPKKIYLVGMDCNIGTMGHFKGGITDVAKLRGQKLCATTFKIIDNWNEAQEFQETYYPDTEIISLNPVGLKGLFTDSYSEKYLNSQDKKVYDEDFKNFVSNPYKTYLDENDFSNKLEKLKNNLKGKKVLLYCAGIFFQNIYKNYDLSGFDVVGISDFKFRKAAPEKFLGFDTITPSEIDKIEFDCILVTTLKYEPVIEELEKLDFANKNVKIMPLVKNIQQRK
jgi:hypothetical protein